MLLSTVEVGKPCYALLEGENRTGPKIVSLTSGRVCSAIYGFSAKSFYDRFLEQSDQALTPYPLVKGYFRNQVDAAGDVLKLVVLDAAGPQETNLEAITIDSAWEAHENRASHVTADYQLEFDPQANAYKVVESY